ncbi:MAG: 60S ribosomal protein L31 [Nanoarchaeota archaeon]|nr:60S ribosomal protein L31 [Nanoarchaeota archaeon]MBU1704486.1 60S ribosomal protein L31 [Nanoarchaeota archaeon]
MAKKTEDKPVLERTYNVPLRKEWLKSPRYKRAKKAMTALKQFLAKHTKSENVKIGKYANLEIWKHGIKNPPHHIKVDVVKDKEGVVTAELVGAPKEKAPEPKKPAKKETAGKFEEEVQKLKSKTKEVMKEKAEELSEKIEEAKEEKAEEAKDIQKEELKELKEQVMKKPHRSKSVQDNSEKKSETNVKSPRSDQGMSRGEHRVKSQ